MSKTITVRISKELHRKIKIIAAMEFMTVKGVIEKLMGMAMAARGDND